jgi:hypothetical protein
VACRCHRASSKTFSSATSLRGRARPGASRRIVSASFNFPSTAKCSRSRVLLFAVRFADTLGFGRAVSEPGVAGILTFCRESQRGSAVHARRVRIRSIPFSSRILATASSTRISAALVAAVHTGTWPCSRVSRSTGTLRLRTGPVLRYGAVTVALVAATFAARRRDYSSRRVFQQERRAALATMLLLFRCETLARAGREGGGLFWKRQQPSIAPCTTRLRAPARPLRALSARIGGVRGVGDLRRGRALALIRRSSSGATHARPLRRWFIALSARPRILG